MSKKNPTKNPISAPETPASPPPTGDLALVIARDERGTHILRRRSEDAAIEQGVLQPVVEGRPIGGEIVTLRARPESPLLFEVRSEFETPARALARASTDGPAQVATDAYRRGWEAVWGAAIGETRGRTLN